MGPARQRGFLLILAVMLIAVAATMAAVMVTLMAGGAQSGALDAASTRALYIADSGQERATNALLTPTLANRVACNALTGNVAVTNVALGTGQYSVTGGAPVYVATATLTAVLNATATTIPVTSTAGFAAPGRLVIDREVVDYAAVDATNFLGVTRGADGSTATAHANGTRVGQDQCTITATGGEPDVAAPTAQRRVAQAVQLQEGWTAGQASAATRFTTQNLNAVYCFPGGTECWAVGNAGAIGRWDGASWTVYAAPPGVGALRAVTCTAVNNCWIVGDTSGGEVILRWTGGPNWTRLGPSGALPNVNLRSVHCTATNSCWAVGSTWNPPGGGTPNQGAIFWWDGGTWNARQDLAATAPPNTQLNSVHCVDASNCWIVGNQAAGNEVILRLNWTGSWVTSTWTRVGPIGPIPNTDLSSVFCVAVNDCHVVGANSGGEVTLRWTTGPNWARSGPVAGIDNVNFNSVTCVATADCWAVGNASGGNYRIIRWTGGLNWSDSSFALAGAQNLNGVACLNANDCWAVANQGWLLRWNGTSWGLFGAGTTVLRWNTTAWTNVTGNPAIVPAGIGQLNAVSLLSYGDGWMVGNSTAATTTGWVILRWNGTGWVRLPVNTPGANALNLNGVHGLSATDGWAVGNTGGGGGGGCTNNRARILRWNGASWGCTASPSNQSLNSVFMVATNDGWAVGSSGGGGGGSCTNNRARIIRWNGGAWNCVASPSNQSLNSVFMVSATDGWAVGNSGGGGGGACTNNMARILRWNGPAWNCVASPTPRNLYSVHMVSATDGWAVGQALTTGPATQRWNVLRWNNPVANTWNVVTVNTAGVNAQDLQEVACTTGNDCWAVGNAGARLHWDGTTSTWSAATTPVVATNLLSLGLIGPRTRPQSGWREVFP